MKRYEPNPEDYIEAAMNTYLDAESFEDWVRMTREEFGDETAEVFGREAKEPLEIEFFEDIPVGSCSGSFCLISQENGTFIEGGFASVSHAVEFAARMGWKIDPDSIEQWNREVLKYRLRGHVKVGGIPSVSP